MKNENLKAYIPILIPLAYEDFKNEVDDALKEIVSLSGKIIFPLGDYGSSGVSVELISNLEEDEDLIRNWVKPNHCREFIILKLSLGTVNLQGISLEIQPAEKELCGISVQELHELLLSDIFEKLIYDFFLVTHISSPGCFDVSDGYIFKGSKLVKRTKSMVNSMREAVKISESYGWPLLHKLKTIDVWHWILKNYDIVSGISNNRLGRAFNAFSYLFKREVGEDDNLDIVWVLIGLESLFTNGNTGITECECQ